MSDLIKDFKTVFSIAEQVLFNPIKSTKKHFTIRDSVTYITLLSVLPGFLFSLVFYSFPSVYKFETNYGVASFILWPIYILLCCIIALLLNSGVIHFFGKLFRLIKRDYSYTCTAISYGLTPFVLLGWIPVINILANIWSFIIQIIALSQQQKISYLKSFFVLILPEIIAGFIFLLILLLVLIIGTSLS